SPFCGSMLLNSPFPSVWTPGANQYVLPPRLKLKFALLPAGTLIDPFGCCAGPVRTFLFPQISAGAFVGGPVTVLAAACACVNDSVGAEAAAADDEDVADVDDEAAAGEFTAA